MKGYKFKVRVLRYDNRGRMIEKIHENLSYSSAVDLFRFYVDAILEFNLDVRCVNIFLGKRSIKLFTNH